MQILIILDNCINIEYQRIQMCNVKQGIKVYHFDEQSNIFILFDLHVTVKLKNIYV